MEWQLNGGESPPRLHHGPPNEAQENMEGESEAPEEPEPEEEEKKRVIAKQS